MTEGETKTLNAWALSDSQYDVGEKTWRDATSNIVVLSTSDYSATILALSPGTAQIRHNRVYYNNGKNYDNIYYTITINKSSYPKIQLTPSTQSNRVLKGTVLTLTPSVSGSTIYYSTSGSVTPGKSSTFPTSGITLNSTTTVRAQAVKSGYPLSDVFEHTYTVIPNSDFQAKVAGGATLHFKIINESAKTCQLYFVPDTEMGELTIPEQVNGYTVKEIGNQACLDCSKLTKIILPSTINKIGTDAFKGCTGLKSINIPEGVTSISSNAFNGCNSLISIDLPKGLTSINSSAFFDCKALPLVIIPKTVTSIASNAFAGCPNLKSITSFIHTPFAIDDNVFTTYNSSVSLNVPLGSATKYKSTSGWMQFVNINEVPDPDITYITGIILNETEIELFEDEGKMLKATVTPTDATDKTVTWTTSNNQVATVSTNGLVIGVKEGSTTITCTANDNSGVKATCTVTVKKKPVPVSQIILNKTTLTLEKSKDYQLTATIKPDNATNKGVTWTTDNAQVADVTNTGLITALAEGSATITCTAIDGSGVKATCIVTVTPRQVLVTDISLNKTEITLYESEKEQITATLSPDNATVKTVTWTSNNKNVATVSENGLVEAITEGSAIITCTAIDGSGVKATCTVTVKKKPVPVSQIILNKTTLTLEKSKDYQLTATIKPDNATNKGVTWTTDNAQVADVTNTGLITALAEGSATITCTAIDGSGVKATCIVTVTPRQVLVTDISLNKTEITLYESEKEQITATLSPDNATVKTVTWTSNNKNVATVSENGLVEAITEGSAIITCTAIDGSGVKATCTVTVKKKPVLVSQIILSQTTLTLEVFKDYQLTATIKPDNATNKGVTWSSNQRGIATVDSYGKVTALSVGTATITCEANDGSGVSSMCNVTVISAPTPEPSSAMLSIEEFTIKSGEEATMVIDLTNPNDEITLVQFDLRLPTGLTVKKTDGEYDIDIADSNRTTWRKHSLDANAQADGTIRFLLASSSNATLSGKEGAIIKMTLVADNSYEEGIIRLENILLVTPDEKEVKASDVEHFTSDIIGVTMVVDKKTPVFSLSGQRLTSPRKGINIIGGKKIVIK